MGPYHRATVVTKERAAAVAGKRELPEEVTVTLSDVAGACREGLLALAVTHGPRGDERAPGGEWSGG